MDPRMDMAAAYNAPQQPNPQQQFMLEAMSMGVEPQAIGQFMELMFPQAPASAMPKQMSTEELKQSGNVKSGLRAIDDIRGYIGQDSGVQLKNLLPGFLKDPTTKQYGTAIQQAVDVIGRMRSGGAITDDESARFEAFLPSTLDDQDTVNYKLGEMQQLFQDLMPGQMSSQNLESQYAPTQQGAGMQFPVGGAMTDREMMRGNGYF